MFRLAPDGMKQLSAMSKNDDALARIRNALEHLAMRAPQVLLLEGGSEQVRLQMALYWAQLAKCPQALVARADGRMAKPCEQCAVCRQITDNELLDLHIYDGRISNKQDEEAPGPVRALSMENMHVLKGINATAPHGEGKRVAIFQGMSQTREEALNSLLKTLEEPSPHTLFVLLAPQRQQILSTLVSRSFCLTLPWSSCRDKNGALASWEKDMGIFLSKGVGFLDKIAVKGAVDAAMATLIIMACQRALGRVISGAAWSDNSLDEALVPLAHNIEAAMLFGQWATEAQTMLAGSVSPARVLEGFFTRAFVLLKS